jgi:dihydrofolate synthase/folylpolyglutamate synthase
LALTRRSSYAATLRYLYALQNRGMKFGLRNIRGLLVSAGNPERGFPTIHVAGTNGKGSTAAFLASAFMEAGYRTGLYTSPHLVRFTERIRINGREISEKRLAAYVAALRPAVEKTRATFFEATTAVAFRYFADERVDIAIVEVGLGGRLDATNTLAPLASVITTIGFDHMEYLGPTLPAIAREKGGIIKRRTPVIVGVLGHEAERVIETIAREREAPLVWARDRIVLDCGVGGRISFRGRHLRTGLVKVGLAGAHQTWNAALAVAVLDRLLERRSFASRYRRLGSRSVARGLERVRRNTGLEGRMSLAGRGVLLDVAHNRDGMHTAIASLLESGAEDLTVVFGVMKDKEYLRMLRELEWVAGSVITVQPRMARAASSAVLCKAARRMGLRAVDGGSVAGGLRRALRGKNRVLVIGSHYVVGEALRVLKKNA